MSPERERADMPHHCGAWAAIAITTLGAIAGLLAAAAATMILERSAR